MREALWAELLKARRSRLPALTTLAFTIVAVVCGLFMFILADPQRARALGLLGDKAQLSGASADWPGYLALLAQAVAVGGMLIYGMIAIWLFGREFSDHTAKDLLTTPLALAASIGRGYLAAVATMFVMLFSAQVIAALGFGAYFPYSVPGLYAGIAGPDQDPPGTLGIALVPATATAGALMTIAWWRRADHTR